MSKKCHQFKKKRPKKFKNFLGIAPKIDPKFIATYGLKNKIDESILKKIIIIVLNIKIKYLFFKKWSISSCCPKLLYNMIKTTLHKYIFFFVVI